MAISLYDVSIGTYLQVLGAVEGFLKKGAEHCAGKGIAPAEVVETSLYPDMLPFRFQLVSVAHHSLGAIKALESGLFKPPPSMPDLDYQGLQKLVADAHTGLKGYSRDAIAKLEGKDVAFELGDRKMPFVSEDFVLTFSLPNLYFHAATAYDILRMKGVALGKRDFLGAIRMKR